MVAGKPEIGYSSDLPRTSRANRPSQLQATRPGCRTFFPRETRASRHSRPRSAGTDRQERAGGSATAGPPPAQPAGYGPRAGSGNLPRRATAAGQAARRERDRDRDRRRDRDRQRPHRGGLRGGRARKRKPLPPPGSAWRCPAAMADEEEDVPVSGRGAADGALRPTSPPPAGSAPVPRRGGWWGKARGRAPPHRRGR